MLNEEDLAYDRTSEVVLAFDSGASGATVRAFSETGGYMADLLCSLHTFYKRWCFG